jgi:hypothetical protein
MKTLLLLAALAQVQPGNWELGVTTWMAGADKPVGPLQRTQCFTEADARDPSRVLGGGPSCEFSNQRESGGVLTFDVKCGGPLPMSGTGSIRQGADAFEGDLELSAGQGFGMRSKITGKRLGPC